MTAVLVVRHAVAVARSEWQDHDDGRPLTERGRRQADALVGQLAGHRVARILSSPSTRCIQTVAPLARACGLAVHTSPALAEGAGAAAIALVHGVEGGTVLCSHGDVIDEVLKELVAGDRVADGPRCQKGSTWVLARRPGGALAGERYLPPPA